MKKLLGRLLQRFSALSLNYRFTILFAIGLISTLTLTQIPLTQASLEGRANMCKFIARTVQAQGAKALAEGNSYLTSLREDLNWMGWEVWIADESGRILSSSFGHPLPLDWSQLPVPKEEYELAWGPKIRSLNPNVAVMRLVSSSPRFMIFYADFSRNLEGKIVVAIITSILFNILLAHLVLMLAIKNSPSSRLQSDKGFTLLETTIVMTLLLIGLFAFLQIMKLTSKSTSHTNLRLAITSLNDTVRNGVDCPQTIAKNAINAPIDCQAGNYKALELYDSRGVRIGTPITPSGAKFDPFSNTTNAGSSQIGSWSVRAYCDAVTDSLVVRFARYDGPNVFHADPLLKRPYNWDDSSENPLFGTVDRQLCKGISSGTPGGGRTSIATARFQLAPLGTRNCTSSFDKNGKTYLVAIGAPEYILLIPDSTRIVANVQCPAGQRAISGGAECGTGLSTGNAIGPGDPSGSLSSSFPSADGTGWNLMCCVEGTPRGDAVAYAVCANP